MFKYIVIFLTLMCACNPAESVQDRQPISGKPVPERPRDPVKLAQEVLPPQSANAPFTCRPIGIFEDQEVTCEVLTPVPGTTYTWTSEGDPEQVMQTGTTLRLNPTNDQWRLFDITLTATSACNDGACTSDTDSLDLVVLPREWQYPPE